MPPWLPTLRADVSAEEESMNGLIPRVEDEEPGCCSTAEEGRTSQSRRVWRGVQLRFCGAGGQGQGSSLRGPRCCRRRGEGGEGRRGGRGGRGGRQDFRRRVFGSSPSSEPVWIWRERVQGSSLRILEIIDWIAVIPGAIVRCQIGEVVGVKHGKAWFGGLLLGLPARSLPSPQRTQVPTSKQSQAAQRSAAGRNQGLSDLWRTANPTVRHQNYRTPTPMLLSRTRPSTTANHEPQTTLSRSFAAHSTPVCTTPTTARGLAARLGAVRYSRSALLDRTVAWVSASL